MEQHERRHDTRAHELPGPTGGDPPPADLTPLRLRARQLIDAGREAVARSLSRDSVAFMRSVQQEGGQ